MGLRRVSPDEAFARWGPSIWRLGRPSEVRDRSGRLWVPTYSGWLLRTWTGYRFFFEPPDHINCRCVIA